MSALQSRCYLPRPANQNTSKPLPATGRYTSKSRFFSFRCLCRCYRVTICLSGIIGSNGSIWWNLCLVISLSLSLGGETKAWERWQEKRSTGLEGAVAWTVISFLTSVPKTIRVQKLVRKRMMNAHANAPYLSYPVISSISWLTCWTKDKKYEPGEGWDDAWTSCDYTDRNKEKTNRSVIARFKHRIGCYR